MHFATPIVALLLSTTAIAWNWNPFKWFPTGPSLSKPRWNPISTPHSRKPKTTITSWIPHSTTKPIQFRTCDTAAISVFIPYSVPQPGHAFENYLQQSICQAPPTFTGLIAKNRFEEDYERFAYYFNKDYTRVPRACRRRFKKVVKRGNIPRSYEKYIRKERKRCGKKVGKVNPGDGYPHGRKGQLPVSAAAGSHGRAMLSLTRRAIFGAAMAYVWGQAML